MIQKDRSGFVEVFMVELLFRKEPYIDRDLLNRKMLRFISKEAKQTQGWEEADIENTFIYFHTDQETFDNRTPQTCVMPHPVDISIDRYHDSLQQSWHWPQAESVVRECTYGLLVTDFMAYSLYYKNRLTLFQNALNAILDTIPCDAMYWNSSQKLLDPVKYLEALEYDEVLYGPVNLRLFNVENPEQAKPNQKQIVMDTCGLSAIGLPDLQCHFYAPDDPRVPASQQDAVIANVRGFLLDMLYYLYDKGNVIEDGEICELVDQNPS